MDKLIESFPNQIKRAIEIGEKIEVQTADTPILNVLISGLGGSGIGGTIFSNIMKSQLKVPLTVNKTYTAPAFVSENTLVVAVSYSGNTEETISVLKQAYQIGAKIVCLTSGGEFEKYANEKKLDIVKVDGGMPPRAAFALSFVQLFYIFNRLGLIDDTFKSDLKSALELIALKQSEIKEKAKTVAHRLHGTIPIIYTANDYEGVAIRFRQQINENSKMLCWHNVIPEMNHNELVGWTKENENLSVVFLKNNDDYDRNKTRMDFVRNIVSKYINVIEEIYSVGDSTIEKSIYLIHLCDWISYFLAIENNADPIEINIITSLKNKLAEQPL